ncbi:MAG: MFS transporter [Geminicoccaceae bacterium]|nr:MFS transporter [Geminicoccaceae bacterium]MCB9944838.1 MFS transporter [Geminicoccaceae bacterium]
MKRKNMGSEARESRSRTAEGSLFAPLAETRFRQLWSANLLSNLGWLIQGVGAAWLMAELTSSPQMVALVQTMTQLPILVFALFAGTAGDLWDKRWVLMAAQLWMLSISAILAVLSFAGLVTPAVLLAFTFMLGAGAALNGPVFQAVVREIVRPQMLAGAVVINAVAFNLARAVGPAIGGGIVATAGAEAAFLFNAVSYVALILVLLFNLPASPRNEIPRERLGSAILAGMRYVSQTPDIWRAMGRASLYGFAAPAVMALMPLIVRDEMEGGAIVFGLMLGVFGIGALIGAFVVQPLRQKVGAERLVTFQAGLFGGALLTLGMTSAPVAVVLAVMVSGSCWLGAFSTFNISVQLTTAPWVQSRVLAIYQMALFGTMALGSWFWGLIAELTDIRIAMLVAGLSMLGGLALAPWFRLAASGPPDFSPSGRSEPEAMLPVHGSDGPILNRMEYRVALHDAPAFVLAMDDLGHVRRRNGAMRWRLFQDLADPEHWTETFLLADWDELRRFNRRESATDIAIETRVWKFEQSGERPVARYMIARRHDSRFALDPDEEARRQL